MEGLTCDILQVSISTQKGIR